MLGFILIIALIFMTPLYCYFMDRWGPLIITILLGKKEWLDEDLRQSRMCDSMPPPKMPWHKDHVTPPWQEYWDHKPKD